MSDAHQLVTNLGGRWSGSYGLCRCPAHDDRNPSLKVSLSDTGDIRVHCFTGCDWRAVKSVLRQRGLLPEWNGEEVSVETGTERKKRREQEDRDRAQRRRWALSIWKGSIDPTRTPTEMYLRSRGVGILPLTIKHNPNLKHVDTGLYFPTMISAVTRWPSREVIGIHRTFLLPDGSDKAQVSSPKKMAGECSGGAVRLAAHTDSLGLSEGIESGLSAQQETNVPVWACLSTSGLRSVSVPDSVKNIIIFADHDEPGIRAANEAAERLRCGGQTVKIALPPEAGSDFNDLITSTAALKDSAA